VSFMRISRFLRKIAKGRRVIIAFLFRMTSRFGVGTIVAESGIYSILTLGCDSLDKKYARFTLLYDFKGDSYSLLPNFM
jgi:hypothetical protein